MLSESVNSRDSLGRTALQVAAHEGHIATSTALLDRRCDIAAADEEGFTALHAAAAGGHVRILQLLLARGAAVDAPSKRGWAPLHIAAEQGHADVCDMLTTNGANVRVRSRNNLEPLHLAAASGDVATCRVLVSAGASAVARDVAGTQPLHFAAMKGHKIVFAWLLSHGADLSAFTDSGWTATHMAAEFGHVGVLSECGEGPHLSVASKHRLWTPLHIAAVKGQVATFRALLVQGADIHSRDCDGETAAHLAAWADHMSVIECILLHPEGKNVLLAEDNSHRRPVDVAPAWGRTILLLTRYGYVVKSATDVETLPGSASDCASTGSIDADTIATAPSGPISVSSIDTTFAVGPKSLVPLLAQVQDLAGVLGGDARVKTILSQALDSLLCIQDESSGTLSSSEVDDCGSATAEVVASAALPLPPTIPTLHLPPTGPGADISAASVSLLSSLLTESSLNDAETNVPSVTAAPTLHSEGTSDAFIGGAASSTNGVNLAGCSHDCGECLT